jgi:hypothetical protein
MLLLSDQLDDFAQRLVRARALHWQTQVDQALPAARRQDPMARLAALTRVLIAQRPPGDVFHAAELDLAARWLALALQAGAPWREARATAMLHAAAGLGAQWFQDDRLLPAKDQLAIDTDQATALRPLLAEPQGKRFKGAAQRAQALAPGLRMGLRRALEADCSDAALQRLVLVAFAPPDEPDDPEAAAQADAAAPDIDELTPPWPPEAQRFIDHERRIQAEAGLSDPAAARLCLAGDLVLGLGRCVRVVQQAAASTPSPATPPIDTLREALHATTRPQH